MQDRKEIIEILTKYATRITLSDKELKTLKDWKDSSSENLQLFEELTDKNELALQLTLLSTIDVDKDWDTFKKRLVTPRRKEVSILKKLIPYAAAIAVGLFLVAIYYRYSDRQENHTTAYQTASTFDIEAASQGATLVLADGNSIELDQKQIIKNDQGLTLNATGSELLVSVDQQEAMASMEQNTLIVPKGAFYTIVLSDQTKVWLNADSKLSFPSNFSAEERRVKVEGEAFFEVNHEAKRPFYVQTADIEVKVLGTKFNVNTYTKNSKTTLESGKVELSYNNQKTVLKPGETAEYINPTLAITQANMNKTLAWKNQEFFFENDNMVHIAYDLSRWYNVQVKFDRDIDLKKQYSGSMSRHLSLAKVLTVLQFGSDFDFEIRDKELLIKNK